MPSNEWNQRSAYLFVKSDWKAGEAVWKKVQAWPETIGAWMVTGNWGVIVWIDAHTWEDLYDKVVEIRAMKGVSATSTHLVYKGTKDAKWWWEWPAGAWVLLRSPHLNGEMRSISKWNWATSVASIPGDWDYLMWNGAKDWDKVWSNVAEMNRVGWQTETLVPIKAWWNKTWKNAWWGAEEEESCAACPGCR
ncbi:MAG: Lrp/AsnC ligand binding domain-containing protein [Elusimicrobiota bacterium]|jgi:hypothetical protein